MNKLEQAAAQAIRPPAESVVLGRNTPCRVERAQYQDRQRRQRVCRDRGRDRGRVIDAVNLPERQHVEGMEPSDEPRRRNRLADDEKDDQQERSLERQVDARIGARNI